MRVLEAVAAEPDGIASAEIARRADLSINAAHRICRTLDSLGYLSRNPESKHYFLSTRLLQIARPKSGGLDLVDCAMGPMRLLRDETAETVLLNVLSGDCQVLIHQLPALAAPRITWDVGARIDLYSNAPGKVLLAFSPPEAQTALLAVQSFERRTPNTITSCVELKRELTAIRRDGFALDRGELTEGIHCVAAPVFDAEDRIAATVCLSGPSFRVNADMLPDLIRKTLACARAVEICLGRKQEKAE